VTILAIVAGAALIAVAILAAALMQTRNDIRRLSERVIRADGESTASLELDSFGAAGDLASRIYRTRTDLLRRIDAAEWHQALLRQILDGMGEGVLAIDGDHRVVLANRSLSRLLALEPGVVGRALTEVVRNARVFAAFDRALENGEATERVTLPLGGEQRHIEIRAFRLPSHDLAAAALFIDVTRVERLEEMRREFLADFSHEARTPLAALRSAVDSFEAASTKEEEEQLRRIITRQLLRLERLVNDLSELTRIEFGDLPLEQQDVDLRALVDGVCSDFAERAAGKRLRFAVRGDSVHVAGDFMRIEQAIANLIDNAIKYGGSDSTIEIEVADRGDSAAVRVRDHGEGIAPEETTRIFRRFYRVDKSRSQEVPGTGLGLAVTRHLILRHGGSIEVESTPGEGATFIVTLPK
jgi:signal transduction histidine kinase